MVGLLQPVCQIDWFVRCWTFWTSMWWWSFWRAQVSQYGGWVCHCFDTYRSGSYASCWFRRCCQLALRRWASPTYHYTSFHLRALSRHWPCSRCFRNRFPPSNLNVSYCKLRVFWWVRSSQVSMLPRAGSHIDHLVYEAMLPQGVSRSHAFSYLQPKFLRHQWHVWTSILCKPCKQPGRWDHVRVSVLHLNLSKGWHDPRWSKMIQDVWEGPRAMSQWPSAHRSLGRGRDWADLGQLAIGPEPKQHKYSPDVSQGIF